MKNKENKSKKLIDDDLELLAVTKSRYKESKKHRDEWRIEAKQSYDFKAIRQWEEMDVKILEEQNRPVITFDRTGPIIDAVAGLEVGNRQEVRYFPREQGDVKLNEELSGAAKWVRDECDAEDEESDAFMDVLVSGMGWVETRIDYDDDPDGKIWIERVDPFEMYWDSSAKKKNLSDRRWDQRIKWMPTDDVKRLWPEVLEDISPSVESLWSDDDDQDSPHDADNETAYEKERTGYDKSKDEYRVIHHQWYELEPIYRVGDPSSGRVLEFSPSKFRKLKDRLDLMGVKYIKQNVKVYYHAFITGDTVLEKGEAPCKKSFTRHCITAKRDRNKNLWFGLLRSMIDPQKWTNKLFSQTLHIVNSNSKGGLYYEEGAVSHPNSLAEEIGKAAPIIKLKPGGLKKLEHRAPAPYPAGMDRLLDICVNSIPHASGVNLEMLGLAGRDQPGVLEDQRKRAGMTILATIFDSLRRYRKEQGRTLLYFINKYISDGRLIRITGTNGKEYRPLNRSDENVKYDVIVDESPTSPNLKERVWSMMIANLPNFLQAGYPPPPEFLDYSPLPETVIQKWKEAIKQSKQNPIQQQLGQLEIALKQTQISKDKAKAILDIAKAEQTEVGNQVNLYKAIVEGLSQSAAQAESLTGAFPGTVPGGMSGTGIN